ncbi:hypothetical protein [Methylophilus sp. 3sh_L]|uniref:hypothetical protein n=1 Tax=Methylophilus sp. 3sh_L TaxID=3377114 RepID=UPI00398F0990
MSTAKRILTVGLELAAAETTYASFRSKMSLLDWDIVLFKPDIYEFVENYYTTYQGKPSLGDTASFEAKECCEHWRREIKQAVETGKTVFVYLPQVYEVFADTGQRSYSGTGRNQKTTRHVALLSNYDALPVKVGPVVTTGSSMKLSPIGAEVLAPYWAEFSARSTFQVVLSSTDLPPCVLTRAGDKTVGAIYRSKTSAGTLLLLPDIDFYASNFLKGKNWTAAAKQFAGAFISSIVALDKALRSASEITPEPSWATGADYSLQSEVKLRVELLAAERAVEEAQKRKELIAEALNAAGSPRALLYEKGKPLEAAIIEALRILGFKAAPFKESDSEFDVVFECAEGRLIGEAEGKDTKAVNIDKLRQLSMNIHEDLQREDVSAPAKPVLFGNGFRLQPPQEREDPFTEKCHSAAATSSTALVATADLFVPVQYILSENDQDYAAICRQALLSSIGRVKFPLPPKRNAPSMENSDVVASDA